MASLAIEATTRKETRKGLRDKREQGQLPAVVYGPKRKSTNLYLNEQDFARLFAEAEYTHLLDLNIDGEKQDAKVIIREVQSSPLGDEILHVGLFELDMGHRFTVSVPVHIEGVSPAVKNNIGILVTPISELTVRCLPKDIPEEIIVDINKLGDIGDAVKIEDIDLPEGVEWVSDVVLSDNLAFIVPPQKEEVIEEATAMAEEGEEEEGEEGEVAEEGEGEGEEGEGGEEGAKPEGEDQQNDEGGKGKE